MKKCKKCKHSECCVLTGRLMSMESLKSVGFFVVGCIVKGQKLLFVVE